MIDFHVHYNKDYPLIDKACIFPFCEDIYERDNPDFRDSIEWQNKRVRENERNIGIKNTIPFLFLWTDFNIKDIDKYGGVKIHRHWNEPEYDWESREGKKALDAIRDLNIPVIIDDLPHRIVRFIKEFAIGINIVVPHFTMYREIVKEDVFHLPNVYVDTSLSLVSSINDYIKRFGVERILFVSDWPYSSPDKEVLKILKLSISMAKKKQILETNALKLLESFE
jgi:hypothetical protein